MIQRCMKCVLEYIKKWAKLCKMIVKYDTVFVFGVNFDICGFDHLGALICVDICVKTVFYISSQQSAKCRMTARA